MIGLAFKVSDGFQKVVAEYTNLFGRDVSAKARLDHCLIFKPGYEIHNASRNTNRDRSSPHCFFPCLEATLQLNSNGSGNFRNNAVPLGTLSLDPLIGLCAWSMRDKMPRVPTFEIS